MPNQNSRLEVYTVQSRDNKTDSVYTHVYSPASQWAEVKVLVNANAPYKFEFRSTKENSYGYVGIDHIQILTEKVITTESTTTTTIATTTTTTPTTLMTVTTTTQRPIETTEETTTKQTTTEQVTTTTTDAPTTREQTTTEQTTLVTTTELLTTVKKVLTTKGIVRLPSTTPEITTEFHPTTENLQTTGCSCKCPTVPTVCAGDGPPTTKPVSSPTFCDVPADQRSVLDQYSCNFDHGTCGFNISTYPHLWELASQRYGDPTVGEIVGDHSLEALGGYLLFNTYNNHVQSGMEHVFLSPVLLPFTQYCVTFWYNMPNNESRLQLTAAFDNGTRQLLWKQENQKTNGWTKVKIAFKENSNFRLQFGSRKDDREGFLAVDDIQVSAAKSRFPREIRMRQLANLNGILADDTSGCTCTCPAYHVIDCDKSTLSPPYGRSCKDFTGANLVKDASCDFDGGNSCKFTLPVYPHLWDILEYHYGNSTLGIISGDVTKESAGMYAAFTTNDYRVPLGEGGDMTSIPVLHPGKLCLSFWYNMPTDTSSITVFRDTGSNRTVIWSKSHEILKGWQQATVLLNGNETFRIVFSSKKTSMAGYFAIDDIQLYSNVKTL
ncbi:MAM and LDL-receptor class A domain-containing protein 1-like isoform X2 [Ruditapes philippinarum]|nr:MAM and LDL-receptor class A domain-containing protein 1-like isoform X2 [Ruditapes philippinarum]